MIKVKFSKTNARAFSAKAAEVRKAKKLLEDKQEGHIGSSKRRKMLEDAAWAVATGRKPHGRLQELLSALAQDNPKEFVRSVLLQVLPTPPREQPVPPQEVSAKEGIAGSLERLNKWWAEQCKNDGLEGAGPVDQAPVGNDLSANGSRSARPNGRVGEGSRAIGG